ncbi:MAG TPA: hypothetical protein VK752_04280 [Bryobacteraceae bacterium]|jgi:hypothetical protein|nr:hypothetical protein [Bryobacteraceae bacterium]
MRRWLLLLILPFARAQDTVLPDTAAQTASSLSEPSVSEKWDFFFSETASPFTLAAAGFNATVSQMTRSAPLYGRHPWKDGAFPKRAGASLGDIVSQNFFGDFLLASVFHEDTRYVRQGPGKKTWARVRYAITRSVITRTDSGNTTFNFANVLGSAMSAGLSNAYYPDVSRTTSVSLTNLGTSVAGSGLANLMPELGPDVANWIKKKLHIRR